MTGKWVKRAVWGVASVLALCVTAGAQPIPTEDELLATLQNSSAGWEQKQAACRGLQRVGTPKSVPALAALLSDAKLSHMARFALEPMPYDEAGKALRDALATTSGAQRMGVAISLGVRRDAKAVRGLAKVLGDDDADTARAAAGALGRIATSSAVRALNKFNKNAPEHVQPAVYEALLAAAENAMKDGSNRRATQICERLLKSDAPQYVKMGAFYRVMYSDAKNTPDRIDDALEGEDDAYRNLAAQHIAETKGEALTRRYASELDELPANGQVALLRGLGERRDPAAREVVFAATKNANKEVQLAAIKAAGQVGLADDVPALVGLLSSSDADVDAAARSSLSTMKADGVDRALASAVPGATASVKAQLIELLTERMAPEALPLARQSVSDSAIEVRIASLDSIATLGGKDEVPVVIGALAKASDATERSEASSALSVLCSLNKDVVLPDVLSAINSASPESKVVLVRALGDIGTPGALPAVLDAMKDKNSAVSDEAVRVLGNWKGVEAAPHLLKLAQGSNAVRKDIGFRGYVRLAQSQESLDDKAKMLNTAMQMSRRKEEKWVVLSAWGTVPSKRAMDALTPQLNNADVQNEAALAIISAATDIGKKNPADKDSAKAALNAVLKKSKDESIRDRAQKALAALG